MRYDYYIENCKEEWQHEAATARFQPELVKKLLKDCGSVLIELDEKGELTREERKEKGLK